ncbi:MAG: hypothetical protein JRI79_08665 [Deltaproteobacteria bacterium]|nr:hypothetical protein [Deltaproteobacteria bacterium]MBW1919501.1 hypothetical protein [Deltaproteobacteria bacterium]MBW1934860.1 hypothetical protein [Deltaproteobacteria bacterium]MBW1978020.1 hypothetical protein [Deltaproteobacteria bacterium]MBW2045660.1 hypothetical protein [Deltaproteobacteria bacterium]
MAEEEKEKREMEALDYGMIILMIIGTIIIAIGFIKGLVWQPWTGM